MAVVPFTFACSEYPSTLFNTVLFINTFMNFNTLYIFSKMKI